MSISKNILIFLIENRKKEKAPIFRGFLLTKKQVLFLFTCGGDNKTRTYDLYDVNVAL